MRIKPISLNRFKVRIVGKTPLLMDKMPDETKMSILAKQTGKSMSIKKQRNIEQETKNAVHITSTGEIGFPANGFKAGMIESTSFVGDMYFSKKLIRGIKIMNTIDGLVPIKYKKQTVLEHTIGANTKYTPQFHEWSCELEILYDSNNVSAEDLVTLLNYAGFYYGIGIWSPRCKSGGEFGMYEVEIGKRSDDNRRLSAQRGVKE